MIAILHSLFPYLSIIPQRTSTASLAVLLWQITRSVAVSSAIPSFIKGSAFNASSFAKAETDIVIATPYSFVQTAASLLFPLAARVLSIYGVAVYL